MRKKHEGMGKVTNFILQVKSEKTYLTRYKPLKIVGTTILNTCTMVKSLFNGLGGAGEVLKNGAKRGYVPSIL